MIIAKSWPAFALGLLFACDCCGQDSTNQDGRRRDDDTIPARRVPERQAETYEPVRPMDANGRGGQLKVNGQDDKQQDSGVYDTRIDELLKKWCDKTSNVTTLYAEFIRTIQDVAFGDKEISGGSARFSYPDKARLDVTSGQSAESFVLNGKGEIWHFQPPLKQVRIFELPPKTNQNDKEVMNNPVPFLVGMAPEKAKQRYRFQIVSDDENTIRLKITPKKKEDLDDFKWAEVWLNRITFFPDKLLFVEPNNNRMTFVFVGKKLPEKEGKPSVGQLGIYTNIVLGPSDFETGIPKDEAGKPWKSQRHKYGEKPDVKAQAVSRSPEKERGDDANFRETSTPRREERNREREQEDGRYRPDRQ